MSALTRPHCCRCSQRWVSLSVPQLPSSLCSTEDERSCFFLLDLAAWAFTPAPCSARPHGSRSGLAKAGSPLRSVGASPGLWLRCLQSGAQRRLCVSGLPV